jgi:hypothetical protein
MPLNCDLLYAPRTCAIDLGKIVIIMGGAEALHRPRP